MKKIGYMFFAIFFNLFRILPIQKKKIVLFNGHNHALSGNLLEIALALQGREPRYRILSYAKKDLFLGGLPRKIRGMFRFFVVLPYHMATAACVFLNDNFLPLGYCYPSRKAKIVQLWHGAGAFKKFGLSTEKNEKVRKQVIQANSRITHLFVTSKQIVPYYEEAFGIPGDRIYAEGVPITDVYFGERKRQREREQFYLVYPELRGKKILLYTPTFRKTAEENKKLLEHFSVQKIHQVLGKDWVILIKMHPKYPVGNIIENSFCYNMTDYPQVTDLYFVSDLLVTDYSSTIVEYVLLDKPVILYAFDLEKYDRGFYRDYEDTVPGPVAHNEKEFLEILANNTKENQKRQTFAKIQYDYIDNRSTERILSVLEL